MNPFKLFVALTALLLTTLAHATPITSGLQLWLDATDSATVFDGAGLTPGQAGFTGGVALWIDKSGTARDASSDSASRPTYDATALNGNPTITFSGGVFFDLASTITSTEETIFIVTRMFDNGDDRGPWLGNQTNTIQHGVPGSFFNDRDRYFLGTTNGLLSVANDSAPTSDTVVTEVRDNSFVSIFENANLIVTGYSVIHAIEIDTVGWFAYQDRSFFGNISEILFYDRALSESEINSVQDYLAEKYINTSIPEPSTLALLGLGLAGLGLSRRGRPQSQ